MNLTLELLDKKRHNFKDFDCGQNEMNAFLKRFALKNQKLRISKTWIVFDEDDNSGEKSSVVGYFTLTSQHIEPSLITDEKLPNYPLPITFLARIALDLKFQNQGLGKELLFIALEQAWRLSNTGLASYAVVLEVLDDKALNFYKKFKLLRKLNNSETKFFVSMKVLDEMFSKEKDI